MSAITLSIDEDVKDEYTDTCKRLGLTPSAAFNVFARAVVREQGIPFKITAIPQREAAPDTSEQDFVRALWDSYCDFERGATFTRNDLAHARASR